MTNILSVNIGTAKAEAIIIMLRREIFLEGLKNTLSIRGK
jgi:hypothetical protein